MKHSAELRWFHPGKIPGEVARWFTDKPLDPEERIDEYLVLPGATAVGVKLRDQKILEMKARTADPVVSAIGNRATGRRDAWVKWSLPLADASSIRSALDDAHAALISLRKSRTLRKFAWIEGAVTEVPSGGPVAEGCNIELTQLAIVGREQEFHWSLGLESFEARERVDQILSEVAAQFFGASQFPVALDADASMAYPEWINRLLRPQS
jgi:hypothetical protein